MVKKVSVAEEKRSKQYYFSRVDGTKFPRVMEILVNNKLTVQVCESDYDKDDVEEFRLVDLDKLKARFYLEKVSEPVGESQYLHHDIFFRTSFGQYMFFSSCTLEYNETKKAYYVDIIGDFFHSQLRKTRRLSVNEFRTIDFSIGEKIYNGKDISSGGLSIIVPAAEQNKFSKNMELGICTLRFNSVSYEIMESSVVTIFDEKNDNDEVSGNLIVGIKFDNFPVELEDKFFKQMHKEICAEDVRKISQKLGTA